MQPDLKFSRDEYAERLARTRRAMAAQGLDLLVVSDPSNMAWLTGYDGWSFYVHQAVIVPPDGEPVWYGRGQDAAGARRTTWLAHGNIVGYADHYVQSTERHPMDFLAEVLGSRRWDRLAIGVEMDNYWFSAAAALSHVKINNCSLSFFGPSIQSIETRSADCASASRSRHCSNSACSESRRSSTRRSKPTASAAASKQLPTSSSKSSSAGCGPLGGHGSVRHSRARGHNRQTCPDYPANPRPARRGWRSVPF